MGAAVIYGQFVGPKDIEIVEPYMIRLHLHHPAPRLLFAIASQWGGWMVSPAAVAAHTFKGDMAQKWLTTHIVNQR